MKKGPTQQFVLRTLFFPFNYSSDLCLFFPSLSLPLSLSLSFSTSLPKRRKKKFPEKIKSLLFLSPCFFFGLFWTKFLTTNRGWELFLSLSLRKKERNWQKERVRRQCHWMVKRNLFQLISHRFIYSELHLVSSLFLSPLSLSLSLFFFFSSLSLSLPSSNFFSLKRRRRRLESAGVEWCSINDVLLTLTFSPSLSLFLVLSFNEEGEGERGEKWWLFVSHDIFELYQMKDHERKSKRRRGRERERGRIMSSDAVVSFGR